LEEFDQSIEINENFTNLNYKKNDRFNEKDSEYDVPDEESNIKSIERV
jgi:hypothetical protein